MSLALSHLCGCSSLNVGGLPSSPSNSTISTFKMEMQIIDLPVFESTVTRVCLEDIAEALVKIGSSTNKD